MKAIWNGKIIAQSNDTIIVENNHYFPAESVNKEYIKNSDTKSICPWKGTASYYTIKVEGETNIDATWYYPNPKAEAKEITNYVAFWKGINVVEN